MAPLPTGIEDKGKQLGGNIFGTLKKFYGAAIASLLVLLNSKYWEDIKTITMEKIVPALQTLYTDYLKTILYFYWKYFHKF